MQQAVIVRYAGQSLQPLTLNDDQKYRKTKPGTCDRTRLYIALFRMTDPILTLWEPLIGRSLLFD